MANNVLFMSLLAIALVFCPVAFAQSTRTGDQQVTQSVIINGQSTQGVTIIENGYIRSSGCASPQPYVTADRSESGWACFDDATGLWLLHAPGPSGAGASSQSTVIYSQPNTVYDPGTGYYSYPYSYSYSYPYPYYSYSYPWGFYPYPYFGFGPGFGLGFGFGFGHGHGDFHHGAVIAHRGVVVGGGAPVGAFRGGRPVGFAGRQGAFVGHSGGFVGHPGGGFAGHAGGMGGFGHGGMGGGGRR